MRDAFYYYWKMSQQGSNFKVARGVYKFESDTIIIREQYNNYTDKNNLIH